jgi:hypothetical protein
LRYKNEWYAIVRLTGCRRHGNTLKRRPVKTMKKRMPGYHRFEFLRSGWFIAGIVFLPLLLLFAWGVIGILHVFGLL